MSLGAIDLFNQLAKNDFGYFQKIVSVADFMSAKPRTLTLDHKLADAITFFSAVGCRHAPVISPEDGDVVGIVSDRDVLRHRPHRLGTPAEQDEDHRTLQIPLSQIMTRDPLYVSPSASPVEALSAMIDHHVDSVLVFDDRSDLQGIVTPTDLIKVLLLYHHVCTRSSELKRLRLVDLDLRSGVPVDLMFSRGAQTVRDVMTSGISQLTPEDTVERAIHLMQSLATRHVPVVDEKAHLVGIVSDREILSRLTPRRDVGPVTEELGPPRFRSRMFATDDKELLRSKVVAIMRRNPEFVRPEALFVEALRMFLEKRLSGIPVVDSGDDRLCGMVTTTDVMRICRVIMQLAVVPSHAAAELQTVAD